MRICICDDELEILDQLKNFLQSLNKDFSIRTFSTSSQLEKELKKNDIDILFMDIKLKEANGIEIIKKNEKFLKNTKLVYITGYSEYVEDIFETNPTYYLQKPITLERVKKVLNKIEKLEEEKTSIVVTVGNSIEKINCDAVLFIESYARILNIHLTNERVVKTYSKLSAILDRLPSNFIKLHKSYVVNMDQIRSYRPNQVILNNNLEIPIGRKRIKEVRERIMQYIKESVK